MEDLVAHRTLLLKDGMVCLQQKYEAILMLSEDISSYKCGHIPTKTITSALFKSFSDRAVQNGRFR